MDQEFKRWLELQQQISLYRYPNFDEYVSLLSKKHLEDYINYSSWFLI